MMSGEDDELFRADFPEDADVDDDAGSPAPAWDADDPRRQRDQFAPPAVPCECYCLHCQRTFMSDQIWFQRVIGDPTFEGFWMCPTPNCGGAGFTFDIFPTDPNHPANDGWHYFDDDELDDDEFDEQDIDDACDEQVEPFAPADQEGEYDPAEPQYKSLDEQCGDADDDLIEGDEWKIGVAPGEEVPPQMYWPPEARRQWEEEQARYNAPDERPRELDWTNRDRNEPGAINDNDIPF